MTQEVERIASLEANVIHIKESTTRIENKLDTLSNQVSEHDASLKLFKWISGTSGSIVLGAILIKLLALVIT